MKVERQALQEADRIKLEERMQFTRDNYRRRMQSRKRRTLATASTWYSSRSDAAW
jgi:hypothetical protein